MAALGSSRRASAPGHDVGRASARCTDDLGPHRAAWDALVDESPLASPFLRSWWLDAVRVDDPAFLVVEDGDQLLGGLALEQRRRHGVPWFRHIGDSVGDHLDVVARRGHEAVVLSSLRSWWTRSGSRILEVRDGASSDGALGAFAPGATVGAGSPAPYATLPATFDEFVRTLPGELRSTITRSTRRLEREGVVHRVVDGPEGIDRALDDLRSLHASRWSTQSGFLPEFGRFAIAARGAADVGQIVFHELVHDDTVIATEVDFEVGGRTSFYQSGRLEDRRWRGSGTVLKAKAVERACVRGQREYDLLRGAEPYKDAWANGVRPLARIRASHGLAARAALGLVEVDRLGRAGGRRLVRAASKAGADR